MYRCVCRIQPVSTWTSPRWQRTVNRHFSSPTCRLCETCATSLRWVRCGCCFRCSVTLACCVRLTHLVIQFTVMQIEDIILQPMVILITVIPLGDILQTGIITACREPIPHAEFSYCALLLVLSTCRQEEDCCVSVQRLLISCHVCPSLRAIVFHYSFRAGYVNIVKKEEEKKEKKKELKTVWGMSLQQTTLGSSTAIQGTLRFQTVFSVV